MSAAVPPPAARVPSPRPPAGRMGVAWLGDFAPVAHSCSVLLVMWSLCYWLYRRKIFFKL
jgi:hypothetical protein